MNLNPTDDEHALNLASRNLRGLVSLKVYRTSVSENLRKVGELPAPDNKAAYQMTLQGIVTFSGTIAR